MENLLIAQNSILNAEKLDTLSDKYKAVKSSQIVNVLESRGFSLDKVVKIKTRKAEREGKQKHRMIFSNTELLATDHKDGKIQLLVTNSYDGTSSVQFQIGFFRYVCSNGLVAGTTFSTIRINHVGLEIEKKIDQAIVEIAAQAQKLNALILKMKNVNLDTKQINDLQNEAIRIRLPLNKQDNVLSIESWVMRPEDKASDLFTVYNRVQETLIRGTGRIELKTSENTSKLVKIRALRGLDSQTQVNSKLFDLVEEVMHQVA